MTTTEPADRGLVIDAAARFPRPPQPGPSAWPEGDKLTLELIASWRKCRGEMIASHAEGDRLSLFHFRPGPDRDCTDLVNPILGIAEHMGECVPETVLSARELLGAALEILAYQQIGDESVLAAGPVLEIIRNVREGLNKCSGEALLAPKGGTVSEPAA